MENIIVIAVVLAVLALAIFYIGREKKKGKRCVGCPNGGTCASCCAGTQEE